MCAYIRNLLYKWMCGIETQRQLHLQLEYVGMLSIKRVGINQGSKVKSKPREFEQHGNNERHNFPRFTPENYW